MNTIDITSDRNGKIAATIYVLVCLFFLFALKCEAPKEDYNSEGVMVNLGTVDEGQSDNKPEAVQQEEQQEEAAQEQEAAASNEEEQSATQDNVAVNVTAQDKVNNTKKPPNKVEKDAAETKPEVVKKPEVQKPQSDPNALFTGQNNNPNQGTGKQNGDQGNPNGSLESNIYGDITGPGQGESGKGYGLNGRSLGNKPVPVNEEQKFGTVAIKIKVNQQGKVISAEFTSKGSTTTDLYLVNLSIKEAYKVTFNPDSKAPSSQTGWVTFQYKPS